MNTKRRVQADDFKSIRSISGLTASADEKYLAFVVSQADVDKNNYQRNIWMIELDTKQVFQITHSGKDSTPLWLPDSSGLLFVSARDGKPQLYRLPVAMPGEARVLTMMKQGVSSPVIAHDGSKVAFLSGMNSRERQNFGKEDQDSESDESSDPIVVSSIPYRSGTSFHTDRFQQIFVLDLSEDNEPQLVTDADVNFAEPHWTADGKYIWTSRTTEVGADEPNRKSKLFRINIEKREVEQMDLDTVHASLNPIVSQHDQIAFTRFPHEGASMKISRLATADANAVATARDVNLELDLPPVSYKWKDDALYFLAQGWGKASVYRWDADTHSTIECVSGDFKTTDFSVISSDKLAYVASRYDTLQEIFIYDAQSSDTVQLTTFNESFVNSIQIQPVQYLPFESEYHHEIDGWYLLPEDYEDGKQYPLIVNVHGGPHLMWGAHDEAKWHDWQYFASQGYVVFFCNPRGSGGYGEAFQESLFGSWGKIAMVDIMAGVEKLLKKNIVDPEQIFLTGGSYGGYMTVWMLAHSDMFRAAVSQRGVYNLLSFFGTTDIPSFVQNEFGYTPLETPDVLWDHSPLAHVNAIKTPLLILHSENDFRVPISEAEQLFGYLRRAGVETEFVRYPRDGHELSRSGEPKHRVDRVERIVNWFKQYSK